MVGGTIVEVRVISSGKAWVSTRDKRDECAIYLNPAGHRIKSGDGLWWQGDKAFWTPRPTRGGLADVPLQRIGFSGVSKPEPRA